MGGGSSKSTRINDVNYEAVRRVPIFEKANEELDKTEFVNMLKADVDSTMDESTKELLSDALGGFFFLEDEEEDGLRMDLLLRAMKHEAEQCGTYIMKEGEAGSKLYVVEGGDLEVTIDGTVIRHMHRGALIEELALLYNAPRSATVKCISDCTFWVLSREMFKNIQAMAASASMMQRSNWLINCPELQALGSVEMSRLMGALQTMTFKAGENIYEKGAVTGKIVLIEKGSAVINLPPGMESLDIDEVDAKLGIIRPIGNRRKSVSAMSINELYSFMNRDNVAVNKANSKDEPNVIHNNDGTCTVYEGCLIGIAALRAKVDQSDYGAWKWVQIESDAGMAGGVQCPVRVQALDIVQCSIFTVDLFERLYGPVSEVLPSLMANNGHGEISATAVGSCVAPIDPQEYEKEIEFEETDFEFLQVLGRGSYGIVMMARYVKNNSTYALKRLSKIGVIETGQLRHVLDERKLISAVRSPFVVKVLGSYQTPKELVLVTERVDRGDLWSVIYENSVYKKGLPSELVHFYTASIVIALSHIHSKNIAYRDLKPENIMIDDTGNIRVIDFGFAKKIPYTVTDPNTGDIKVHVKSYTLCGTPEYLAPEFIFNTGNDHSVDLWALGVMMHEMYLVKTPFNPKRRNDMTELFTNIASVKRSGVSLSSSIDSRDGSPNARALIAQLLKAEPTEYV